MPAILSAIVVLVLPDAALGVASRNRVGREFDQVLASSVAGTIRDVTLRDAVVTLASSRGLSVVIDRRLNPDQRVSLRLQSVTVRGALRQLAADVGGEMSVLQNVIVIGPAESTRMLRTIVELRQREAGRLTSRRNLTRPRDIAWGQLARPRQILADLATSFGLAVHAEQSLPHDLWAAAELPQVDAATALTVVLSQFGFSFEWRDQGREIAIVPQPSRVALSASIRLPRTGVDAALTRVRESLPDLVLRREGDRLVVQGTVEEIELVRQAISGSHAPRQPVRARADQQQFTLDKTGVPARAVLESVRASGVEVLWDEVALKSAGIDLDRTIDIRAKNAATREFFRLICEPLGADFVVEPYRVRILPR